MNARFAPRPSTILSPASSGKLIRLGALPLLSLLSLIATALPIHSQSLSPAATRPAARADLPDAPDAAPDSPSRPAAYSSSATAIAPILDPTLDTASYPGFAGLAPLSIHPPAGDKVPIQDCPDDETRARECRVHWHQLLIEASLYDAFQDAGNLYAGYWYRYETMHGKWLDRYFNSVLGWKWDRWNDDNPKLDDYVGHPMMGSITNFLWIQNDPKGMTVDFGNNRAYWKSRMRALAFSTAFSMQWKFGPFGEAAIGHNGDHIIVDHGIKTNETGWVELVTTPVGGLGWTIAEDAIDKHIVRKLEDKARTPITLLAISLLTPSRATANIFRFRPPWYRDAYVVKANSFWSDPPGTDGPMHAPGDQNMELYRPRPGDPAAAGDGTGGAVEQPSPAMLPEWPRYGGVHEFGAWWGLSLISGHVWGFAPDVKYMPIDVNYSYLINPHSRGWAFRYAPEVTALAMLDERNQAKNTTRYTQRVRSYGSGVSPVGFRVSFLPENRVQPYFSGNGGFLYFNNRVLSPQGSQFMYTIDYGAGLTIYRKKRQSVSIGYRYQHLSNANISHHNPGLDANTFYVQVSRYRTKGYR